MSTNDQHQSTSDNGGPSPLGQRLRAARSALHPEVSQRDVAKRLDRSPSAVNHWESGKTEPGVKELVQLAQWYKVSTDWLLGVEDDLRAGKRGKDPVPATISFVPVVSPTALSQWRWDAAKELLQTQASYPDGTAAAMLVSTDALATSCPPGSYVVVTRNYNPQPGQIVLATVGRSDEPVLRKYVAEGSTGLLIADDTRYPTYRMDDGVRIVGRVSEIVIRRMVN